MTCLAAVAGEGLQLGEFPCAIAGDNGIADPGGVSGPGPVALQDADADRLLHAGKMRAGTFG
jgi:hypothetical protein